MASIYPYNSAQLEAYLRHYRNQHGLGGIAVYRGARFQSGGGLGNILARIGRFLLPIVASGAQAFIGSTVRGTQEGKSIKEAAKEALEPTFKTALSSTSRQIRRQMSNKQTGSGRRRPRKKSRSKARTSQLVYKAMKRRARKRKSTTKRSKVKRYPRKRVRYLNPPFANF